MKLKLHITAIICLGSSTAQATTPLSELDSRTLVNEVITQVEKKHAFDTRSVAVTIFAGQSYIHEGNNFENSSVQLGAALPASSGNLYRLWLRRVWVTGTSSTQMLSRTPFKQPALMTRYEFHGDFGYSLLEGRSFTRLGPWISDVESSIHALAGGYYSLPNQSSIPKKSDTPTPIDGQEPYNSSLVFSAGLLWQLHFASGFGTYLEMAYNYPLESEPKLKHWKHFSWGLQWSIGN